MRTLVLLLILGGVARAETPVVVDRDRTLEEVQRMSEALAQLRGALDAMGATRNPAIAQQLQAVQWHADKLSRHLADARPLMMPPPAVGRRPMDPGAFGGLLQAVDNEAFSQNKLSVLEQASRTNWFSVSQLKQVIERLNFSADKIHAVELIAPRLLDRQNAFQLYDAFTFEQDKEKVKQILSR